MKKVKTKKVRIKRHLCAKHKLKKWKKKLKRVLKTKCWENVPNVEIDQVKGIYGVKVLKKRGVKTDKEIAIWIAVTKKMTKRCGYCGRTECCKTCNKNKGEMELKCCTKCLITWYCDKECQINDWKKCHKDWCCNKSTKFSFLPGNLTDSFDKEGKIKFIVNLLHQKKL